MKHLSYILIFIMIVSCNNSKHEEYNKKEEYTCPMHPEILKDQAGKCPVCGMDLVKKANVNVPKVFTCPMHPEIIKDQPGTCPVCGMDLVEKQTEGSTLQDSSLQFLLKPTNQFVVSKIETVRLQKRKSFSYNYAAGVITYDPRFSNVVSSRVEGRIEKLYAKYRFQPIKKGDKLMEIYSKDLVTEQQNYVFILNNDADNSAIILAAEGKLELLGFTKEQIQNLKSSKKIQHSVIVYSPFTGHLHDQQPIQANDGMNIQAMTSNQLTVNEGMYVKKGQSVFNIFNTDKVWAIINVAPEQQALLKKDLPIKLFADGVKDTIKAKIDFVEPSLRPEQKTITMRVNLDNFNDNLKIGTIVKAEIQGPVSTGSYLPSSAVLDLGLKNIVFVMRENLFEAVEVKTGIKNNGWVQILAGIEESNAVAENAQMLVDSEAFIKINKK